jgi:hypothetical protein
VAACLRGWALLALFITAVAGCREGEEEPQAERAKPETFEMPTYRFQLPTGWTASIDRDPAAQEGAGFHSDDEYRVHGGISRDPIGATSAPSARARIVGIVEGHRGISNLLEISEAKPLEFDIDGAEAWRAEARFGSEVDSFRMLWVAFQHDGQDYVVTFEGSEPLAKSDLAAFEGLLRSWEFL